MTTTAIRRVHAPCWIHRRRERAAVPLIVSLATVALLVLCGLITVQAQQEPVYYDALDTDWSICCLHRAN